MEQNSTFPEKIIYSLFIKEKEKKAQKELDDYIYRNTIIKGPNKEDFISNLLISFKNVLFDEAKEYRKKLEKEITPIMTIQNIIYIYSKNPYNFFILLNPLFDMFKNLEAKKIVDYTEEIRDFLEGKKEIILKNFNELFEVVIYLIINQEQSVKSVGEDLNNMLKITLMNNRTNLDSNIFDFISFENKILEKTNINQPILDGFLLDWINTICKIGSFNMYTGKLFYDLMPWILKIKNSTINDNSEKANICDKKIKNIFLDKYLKYYYKEKNQIDDCILSFIKLIKNKSISDFSNDYNFLYDLIKKFNYLVEENSENINNIMHNNSPTGLYSPIYRKKNLKSKLKDKDFKWNNIKFSPTVMILPKKSSNLIDTIKNFPKSNTINSSQDSEIIDDISKLIPLNTLNDFIELIIKCKDITKEEQLFKLNSELRKLIGHIPNDYEKFNAKEFIDTIIKGVEKPEIVNKEFLLDWYQLLCEKYEKIISDESISAIINSILKIIKNNNQDKEKNQDLFLLMFKKLQKLDIRKIFSLLSLSLNKINTYSFSYQIDGYLNYYLLTTPRAEYLLSTLISYGKSRNKENRQFYEQIYKIMAYNPMSLLIFCTITEYYELSWNLILKLFKFKFYDDYYIYLSEFVLLMENAKSNHIRLLLLHPADNIYLAKTLYGILMLLPQGKAYNILSNRLYSIKGLLRNSKEIDKTISKETIEDIKYFIDIFIEIQKQKKEK